jgi:ribosomal protein S18 acetylase RimI-like enzyme
VSEIVVAPVALEQTRALRREILRPHQTIEQVAADELPDAYALGAFEDGELIGVGFVVPDGGPGEWRIRSMATRPAARGRGAGSAVLGALIAHAQAKGAVRIWCNARSPARSLYERAGLSVVSEEYFLPHVGPHFVMELRAAI